MPLPVIADVARVALHCNNGGSGQPGTTVNVIHIKRDPSVAWGDAANVLADNLDTATHPSHALMLAPLSSSYGYQQLYLTPLDGTSNTITRDGTLSNWPVGTHSGDYVPQVAAVVRIRTDTRGRSARGRIYLGPLSESVINGGQMSSVSAGDVTAAWEAFSNDIITAGPLQLGVASYLRRAFYGATNIGCVQHTATQRRRNKHTGP
jgi:hypothetical protein